MGKYSPNVIANCLASCAMHNPGGEVVVYGDRRVTWLELWTRSSKLANALIGLGVKKGDKVCFMFHNVPEFLEVNYAVQAAGAVPVPMNYRFIAREVEYQAGHCDASVFIYDSLFNAAVEGAAPRLSKIESFIRLGEGELSGALDYEEVVKSGVARDPEVENDWDDVAAMIYTGGTTGFPKGVMLTYAAHAEMHSALLARVVTRAVDVQLTDEQMAGVGDTFPLPGAKLVLPLTRTGAFKRFMKREGVYKAIYKGLYRAYTHPEVARFAYDKTLKYMIPSMPLFHDASYQILFLASMFGNICFVLVDDVKFNPERVLALAEKEEILFMANVPTGWKKIVGFEGRHKFNLESVKIAATGAGAASAGLKKKIFETFPNIIVVDMFGQTEMTPITTFRIDADPSTLKDRSVGKSIIEAKVVDESGRELPQGEIGEILYKSKTVMKGYYKDEEKTGEVINDGWFRGGDLGYIDDEGEIRLVDRKKECINTGGEKVFPLEVEEVIHEHEAVDDACVIGVPDEDWGSTVRAVVQLKPGKDASEKEIIDFLRDKLAGYKIPKSVVFVKELPLSPVGKVLRAKIREQYGRP